METRVKVVSLSQAICKGHHPHAPAPEALQNAAPVSQISIMGAKRTFDKTSKGSKGAFVRISIKIAVETVVHDFNQRSAESISEMIPKVQACLYALIPSANWRIILSAPRLLSGNIHGPTGPIKDSLY